MGNKTQAIIFDLDGTLIDTMGAFYEMVINNLNRRGISVAEKSISSVGGELLRDYQSSSAKQGITMVFKLFWKIGRKAGLSKSNAIIFSLRCVIQARKVYLSAPIFPDVKSSLIQLHTKGFQLGIYTLASKKQMLDTLYKHEILSFFNPEGLISRNDVRKLKPDPEGVLLALRGCRAESGIFLGDMPVDIIAGNRAGTATIALTTGLIDKPMLQQYCNPTEIFDSLTQASKWILEAFNKQN
jgi:phosphoglycolate phosphatase-like HAD superfamily hydrolase